MDDTTIECCLQEVRAYTVADIAAMRQIGQTVAYNLIKEGHFKTAKIGSSIRVSRTSFEEWLDSLEL
jgi:excisionase family DNA binding protein